MMSTASALGLFLFAAAVAVLLWFVVVKPLKDDEGPLGD